MVSHRDLLLEIEFVLKMCTPERLFRYNNMAAPNNCVGGSETSCPATVPVAPAPPAHWYATGNDFSVASGQKLGAGPEMYNSMSAPHNCVGGSEQVFYCYRMVLINVLSRTTSDTLLLMNFRAKQNPLLHTGLHPRAPPRGQPCSHWQRLDCASPCLLVYIFGCVQAH